MDMPIHEQKVIELARSDRQEARDLKGLYLNSSLPPAAHDESWLYTSFVASLDGRISLDSGEGECRIPAQIANPRDWRLFQELAARADCLITTSRYLRELHCGAAQAQLPVDQQAHSDLIDWRLSNNLNRQPDVAVVGSRLDYVIPSQWIDQGRRIWLLAPIQADRETLARYNIDSGAEVAAQFTGTRARGKMIRQTLADLGYRRIFCIAGPRLAHVLLEDDVLDTLFLTLRHRIIGGEPGTYENIVEGARLPADRDFELKWAYLDISGGHEGAQQFMRYDRIRAG